MHAIRKSHKIQETSRYRDEDEENKAKFEAKTEYAFDVNRNEV